MNRKRRLRSSESRREEEVGLNILAHLKRNAKAEDSLNSTMVAARTTDPSRNYEGQHGLGLVGGSRRTGDKAWGAWPPLLPLEVGPENLSSTEIAQGNVAVSLTGASSALDAVEQAHSLPAVLREKLGFLVAGAIVIFISVVLLMARGLLLPIRWLIDWDARQERLAGSTPATPLTRQSTTNQAFI